MISIAKVPHSQQRYNTVGDWYYDSDGNLFIIVSTIDHPKSDDMEACVIVHELVEALLCEMCGIGQAQVDEFDLGIGASLDEPGDDPRAPYHRCHVQASIFERQLALALNVNWQEYERELDRLSMSYPK